MRAPYSPRPARARRVLIFCACSFGPRGELCKSLHHAAPKVTTVATVIRLESRVADLVSKRDLPKLLRISVVTRPIGKRAAEAVHVNVVAELTERVAERVVAELEQSRVGRTAFAE